MSSASRTVQPSGSSVRRMSSRENGASSTTRTRRDCSIWRRSVYYRLDLGLEELPRVYATRALRGGMESVRAFTPVGVRAAVPHEPVEHELAVRARGDAFRVEERRE